MKRRFIKKWYKETRKISKINKSWSNVRYQSYCCGKLYRYFPLDLHLGEGFTPIDWSKIKRYLNLNKKKLW